jgi:hypothetical protein
MSESLKSKRNPHPAATQSWTSDPEKLSKPGGISLEITLDLVARTAFELERTFPGEVRIDSDSLRPRGQQAIELLSIWARQLEIEKTTGAVARNAEEVVSRWQAEERKKQEEEKAHRYYEEQLGEIEAISRSTPIPFPEAARRVAQKDRNRVKWLERLLKPLADEKIAEFHIFRSIAKKALKERAVPEDFIPLLQKYFPDCRKSYKSWAARQKGKKGGTKRAENQARKKASANHEVKRGSRMR